MAETMAMEALLFGDEESQVFAARQIGKISRKQRHKLAEKDIIPPLISMLHCHDYEAIEASLLALLNLAYGSERNKILIGRCGGIQMLTQLLQLQNESLCGLVIALLLTLSSCIANKLEISRSGAIEQLLHLLSSQLFTPTNMVLHVNALDIISILHNLSTCHDIVAIIALYGGGAILLQVISNTSSSEKSSELVEKSMALLESLFSSSPSPPALIGDTEAETSDMIRILVESIEEGSRMCREHAVGILLMLCQRSRERYRGLILKEGAMPGLLQLSVDGTSVARDKAKALILLLRDCGGGGGGRRVFRAKNVLLEEAMSRIDEGGRAGVSLALLEEMIAKLRA